MFGEYIRKYLGNIWEIFWKYLGNISGIGRNLPHYFPKYVPNYSLNISQTFPKYFPTIPKNFPKHFPKHYRNTCPKTFQQLQRSQYLFYYFLYFRGAALGALFRSPWSSFGVLLPWFWLQVGFLDGFLSPKLEAFCQTLGILPALKSLEEAMTSHSSLQKRPTAPPKANKDPGKLCSATQAPRICCRSGLYIREPSSQYRYNSIFGSPGPNIDINIYIYENVKSKCLICYCYFALFSLLL